MVIFPDVEVTIVSYLKSALTAAGESSIRVATKHSQPDQVLPVEQVVVIAAYNFEQQFVMKVATVTLEVYANTYARANALGLLVESLIRGAVGDQIKKVEVRLGPVRTSEDSDQERRSLDVEILVKGTST
jgi:trehalose/maltose hydrolase-like predicted phosphorylase